MLEESSKKVLNEENFDSTFDNIPCVHVPQISFCFAKLDRGPSSSLAEKKDDEDASSSRISRLKKSKSQASVRKSTNRLSKLERSPKRARKFQESKMAALISNIGKFIIYVREIKKQIEHREIKNISAKQFDLIGDHAFPKDCFEEKRRRRLFLQNVLKKKFQQYLIITLIIFIKFVNKHNLFRFLWRLTLIIWELLCKSIFYNFYHNGQFFLNQLKIGFICKIVNPIFKIPVFLPTNRLILIWKLLICFVVLYELLFIPIGLFFKQNTEKKISSQFESFLRIILWVDLIIDGNISFYRRGELILDRRLILKKYLSSHLPYNLITLGSLHFEWGSKDDEPQLLNSSLNLIKLVFYLRMAQVSHIFNQAEELMRNDETYEALLALLRLLLQIFFITHILCCIWNYAAYNSHRKGERSWHDAIFYSDGTTNDVTLERAYLYSFYWSLTTVITVGYGDISPKNDIEVIVSSLAMLTGSGFFAYGINKIGVIFEKFEKKQKDFKDEFRIIDNFMQRKKIEYSLQIKVFKYLEHLFSKSKSLGVEGEYKILSKLSQNLRKDLLVQANGSLLAKYPLFQQILSQETLDRLSQKVRTLSYAPEEPIFHEGQVDDNSLYFLVNGEVELFVCGICEFSKSKSLGIINEGDSFGHDGFFTRSKRKLSAKSKSFSSIIAISEEEFINIIKEKREDWEKFCMLRDKIFLYNEYTCMKTLCESCRETNHSFSACPYLHYMPKRDLILNKHMYNEPQIRVKQSRNRMVKSKNALLNNIKPMSYSCLSVTSNENSSQEFPNLDSGGSLENDDGDDFPVINYGYRRSDLRRKLFIKSASGRSNQMNKIEDDELDTPEQGASSPSLRKEEYLKNQRINAGGGPEIQNKVQNFLNEELMPLIFGGLNTEKMTSFQYYFPYNNCEEVIKFIDIFNKKDSPLKRLFSKVKNNSKVLFSSRKDHNSTKNFGKLTSGLIQFRNMQRFFLRTQPTKKKM